MVENSGLLASADESRALWPHLFEPFRIAAAAVANIFSARADTANAKDAYEINLKLPGVSADDFDIAVNDRVLTVKSAKEHSHEAQNKRYYVSERSYGAFQRSYRLPGDVDREKIAADFKDGVLTLSLPKAAPAARAEKRIEIRSG